MKHLLFVAGQFPDAGTNVAGLYQGDCDLSFDWAQMTGGPGSNYNPVYASMP
ncbi:MAG: hypothetical protein KDK27_07435 [Leptospiraceae bacterium]|nr:hypothetical protein [Leptospiraceae bacterium]